MSSYVIGTLVELTGIFSDLAGNIVTPDHVICTVKHPTGETSTPDVSSTSQGVYTAQITPSQKGSYQYKIAGTGNVQTAAIGTFTVVGDF